MEAGAATAWVRAGVRGQGIELQHSPFKSRLDARELRNPVEVYEASQLPICSLCTCIGASASAVHEATASPSTLPDNPPALWLPTGCVSGPIRVPMCADGLELGAHSEARVPTTPPTTSKGRWAVPVHSDPPVRQPIPALPTHLHPPQSPSHTAF